MLSTPIRVLGMGRREFETRTNPILIAAICGRLLRDSEQVFAGGLGCDLFTSSRAAFWRPPSQHLVDRRDQLFVIQSLVSYLQPRLPAIIDAVANESFAN